MGAILQSLGRTISAGVVLLIAIIVIVGLATGNWIKLGEHTWWQFFFRWLHVLSGVMWIGLLWYFNFVQTPSMPKIPDEQKPAISKVIAPTALFWFRWAALSTVITGLILAWMNEYIGKALDDPISLGRSGTRVAGHPVILSVLFDDDGVLRGIRFVSDPRGDPGARRMAHLLRLAIINRYEPTGWNCTDLPAAPGETPVGGVFLKQRCEKTTAGRHLMVEAHFLRKPGQSDIDVNGEPTQGQFESWTRFELFDPAYVR